RADAIGRRLYRQASQERAQTKRCLNRSQPHSPARVMARLMLFSTALIILGLAVAGLAAVHYMVGVPGSSHRGPLPPLAAEEADLAAKLEEHVVEIAAREHNLAHHAELERVAHYLQSRLELYGHVARRQSFAVGGNTVHNLEVVIAAQAGIAAPEVIVV